MPSRTWSRWTPAYAARVIDEWTASGVTLTAFARQRGLCVQRLRRWRDRLRAPAGVRPRLVELVPPQPKSVGTLRVICPTGHVLEVVDVDLAHALDVVLRGLREAAC